MHFTSKPAFRSIHPHHAQHQSQIIFHPHYSVGNQISLIDLNELNKANRKITLNLFKSFKSEQKNIKTNQLRKKSSTKQILNNLFFDQKNQILKANKEHLTIMHNKTFKYCVTKHKLKGENGINNFFANSHLVEPCKISPIKIQSRASSTVSNHFEERNHMNFSNKAIRELSRVNRKKASSAMGNLNYVNPEKRGDEIEPWVIMNFESIRL